MAPRTRCFHGVARPRTHRAARRARFRLRKPADSSCASCPPETIPDEAVVSLNLPVLLASLGIACATILVFGMAPAWRSSRPHLDLRHAEQARSSAGRTQQRLLGGFVVTEIALSLALLTLAGLMIRSLVALESAPISFDADHTLVAGIPLAADRYPDADAQNHFYRPASRPRTPASRRARCHHRWLMAAARCKWNARTDSRASPWTSATTRSISSIRPSLPYLAASCFRATSSTSAKSINTRQEMVVSESFARRYLSGTALGRIVHLPQFRPDRQHPLANDAFTIVGVVKDVPVFATYLEGFPEMFVPYSVAPQATGVSSCPSRRPAGDAHRAPAPHRQGHR